MPYSEDPGGPGERQMGSIPRKWLLGAALAAAAAGALLVYEAEEVVGELREQVSEERRVAFQMRELPAAPDVLSRTGSPAQSLAGVEPLAPHRDFADAAIVDGRVFIASSSGVFLYGEGGEAATAFLTGRELPAAPPAALAAALAPDTRRPALLAATAGAGLLLFDPAAQRWRQMLPEAADFADLTCLLPLASGRILLGTARRGLLSFDGRRLESYPPPLANLRVTALAGDEAELWIGAQQGLYRWSAAGLDHWTERERLPDPHILSLARDGDRLFAGTPAGVAEFRGGELQRTIADGFFAASLAVSGDELIVGTLDEGLARVPLRARRVRGNRGDPSAGWPGGEVRRLRVSGGRLFALSPTGLYEEPAQRNGWRLLAEAPAGVLRDGNISALAADSRGRLWVGYFDRGLDVIDPSGRVEISLEDDRIFCVNRIVHDARRNVTAVATANGLALLDESARVRQWLTRADGLLSNHVSDVVFEPGGMVAATAAGVSFIGPRGVQSLNAFHGLVNNHVYTLGRASGRLLAGTLGGLSVLEGGGVRQSFTTANSPLRHNWISAVAWEAGEWFVGTYGGGVARIGANGGWEDFSKDFAGLEINPNALLATPERVYAGTLGGGLWVLERGAGRWSSFFGGLPSRNVTAVVRSGGYLYLGTDNGLVRAPERALGGGR